MRQAWIFATRHSSRFFHVEMYKYEESKYSLFRITKNIDRYHANIKW